MKNSLKIGICFGITSGIITTLGLMTGLQSGTNSKLVVLGGIFTIAIADAFSDSLGIHISEESQKENTPKEVWESTIATFLAKFLFALTFTIPVMLFASLNTAMTVSILWGLSVLSILTYITSRAEHEKPWKPILEHLFTAILVIVITHYVGDFIGKHFAI
jgi:VIT1/CCC1 family predicted Fe2+/Mn2+ transporter